MNNTALRAQAQSANNKHMVLRQIEISKTYEMPKRLVRIGKPRELSSAQREPCQDA